MFILQAESEKMAHVSSAAKVIGVGWARAAGSYTKQAIISKALFRLQLLSLLFVFDN
jgi:hypothetical protein